MKAILFAMLFVTGVANAASLTPVEASKRINIAVDGFSALAGSGVQEFRVRPASTVKEMLLRLAIKEQYSDSEEDFSWVGTDSDAWAADSTNWGEENMRGAFSYIFSAEEGEDQLSPREKAELARNRTKGKRAFELLLNTGVKFGVSPIGGAVQCGVQFAGLAILDPHTGKIYVFAREGSGC